MLPTSLIPRLEQTQTTEAQTYQKHLAEASSPTNITDTTSNDPIQSPGLKMLVAGGAYSSNAFTKNILDAESLTFLKKITWAHFEQHEADPKPLSSISKQEHDWIHKIFHELALPLFNYTQGVKLFLHKRLLQLLAQPVRNGTMNQIVAGMASDYRISFNLPAIEQEVAAATRRAVKAGIEDCSKICFEKESSAPEDPPIQHYKGETFMESGVGVTHAQGKRRAMEDTHVIGEFTYNGENKEHQAKVLALFDGHSGRQVADFAKENLIPILKSYLEQWNFPSLKEKGNIYNALNLALVNLSEACNQKDFPGGSTAVVVLIVDNKRLYTANVGDSRALIINSDDFFQLTEDADPNKPYFAARIQQRGGTVTKGRLYGNTLNMTNALGNFQLACVSPRPDITYYTIESLRTKSNPALTLVLACDGIFEDVSTDQVANFIRKRINQGKNPAEIADQTTRRALAIGSQDNCSCMVYCLPVTPQESQDS